MAGECTLCRCSLHAHQAGLPTPCLVGNDNTTACSKLSAPRHPGVAGVAKYVASLMDTEHEMCNSQRAYCVCRCHQGSASLESPGMAERSGASQTASICARSAHWLIRALRLQSMFYVIFPICAFRRTFKHKNPVSFMLRIRVGGRDRDCWKTTIISEQAGADRGRNTTVLILPHCYATIR